MAGFLKHARTVHRSSNRFCRSVIIALLTSTVVLVCSRGSGLYNWHFFVVISVHRADEQYAPTTVV